MANVARAPRAPKTAPAVTAPVAAVAAPQAAPAALYTLNAKAAALAAAGAAAGKTLQAPAKGLGLAWRAAGYTAPNTRALALAVVAALGTQFTLAQAQAALQAAKAAGTLNLGSGTPGSYCKAFVANGYFAPCSQPSA